MTDDLHSQSSLEALASLAGIVILAGGASKRMGSAKAQLILPTGETLLDYHVRQSIKLNVPIMIADNGRGFLVDKTLLKSNPDLPIFHIVDYGAIVNDTTTSNVHDTGGALVAIESALQSIIKLYDSTSLKDELWLMVISCDSLVPASKLWQELQSFIIKASEHSVICLSDEAHLYPLLGLYRLSTEPKLRGYIDRGERRVMRFIEPIVKTVTISEDWQNLTNFNTPDEFKRACTSLYG